MRRVFFTGAGGVGKTSVLTRLEQSLSAQGIPYVTFLSVSREFFKAQGITSEQAGLERREIDRLAFQSALFNFYCQRLEHACDHARATGAKLFISDRSPHDHLAYLIYNAPNLLVFDQLHDLRFKATQMFNNVVNTCIDPCSVFHFPCVAPWMTENVLRDGMRHAPPGKNFMIDALIESLSGDLDYKHHRQKVIGDATVDARARTILQSVLKDLN
jgi:predicted ATPase